MLIHWCISKVVYSWGGEDFSKWNLRLQVLTTIFFFLAVSILILIPPMPTILTRVRHVIILCQTLWTFSWVRTLCVPIVWTWEKARLLRGKLAIVWNMRKRSSTLMAVEGWVFGGARRISWQCFKIFAVLFGVIVLLSLLFIACFLVAASIEMLWGNRSWILQGLFLFLLGRLLYGLFFR